MIPTFLKITGNITIADPIMGLTVANIVLKEEFFGVSLDVLALLA